MDYNNMNTCYTDQCIRVDPLRSLESHKIPMATSMKFNASRRAVRSSKKVKIPARFTGFVPVDLKESSNGQSMFSPKGKTHGKDSSLCSSPFMVVSPETTFIEYSNFSKDDVFVQEGQIVGYLEDLHPDDVYLHALSPEERMHGVKLDKMMSKIPTDYMEPDEIEVGLTPEDIGINSVSSDSIPPGF